MFIIELNKLVVTCMKSCPPKRCHIINGQSHLNKIDFKIKWGTKTEQKKIGRPEVDL